MIRFSATELELEAMLRFLTRRIRDPQAPPDADGRRRGRLLLTPLTAADRDALRFRRTTRPLVNQLRSEDGPLAWGMRLASDEDAPLVVRRDRATRELHVDPEASRLIVLALGPVHSGGERRREGVLEVRDWVAEEEMVAPDAPADAPRPKGVILLPQALVARDLVERCARRLRRRGHQISGRWHVPPLLPEDDEEGD
jgi:hypothetical protein